MVKHPDCLSCMWSDNIAITGRLSKAYAAAVDVNNALKTINLMQQPRESAIYIPSYHAAAQQPQLLTNLQTQHPEMALPWAKEGVRCLGFPVGNANFVNKSLEDIQESIEKDLPLLAQLDDGLVHFELLSMCTNARLPFFLRGIGHQTAMPFVEKIDAAIWKAFGQFADFPQGFEDNDEYSDARIQFRLPTGTGGMGVTPGSVKAAPAFYVGMSFAFKFAAQAGFEELGTLLRSDAFLETSLYKAYDSARDELRIHGAVSADEVEGLQEKEEDWDKQTPVLPLFSSLVTADPAALNLEDPSQTNLIPDQRKLTRFVHKNTDSLRVADLSNKGNIRASHLSTQAIKAHDNNSQLNRAHKFDPKSDLKHSPLQFLTSTSSLRNRFNKEQWSVYAAYVLGMPMPLCLHPRRINGDLCRCHCTAGPLPDIYGHHKMNCKNNGKKGAHDHIDDCMSAVAKPSGVNYTNDKTLVPSHDDSNKKGDALTTLTRDAWPQVLDFTMVHPYTGNGDWIPNALRDRHNSKMAKHNRAYERQGICFVPCVVTTYGAMGAEFVRLLYILARRQAEVIITHHRPDADFNHLLGVCFSSNKAQVGVAVARGMAMRALSCTKDGYRRIRIGNLGAFPGHLEQDLHVLGGPGVIVAALAPGA